MDHLRNSDSVSDKKVKCFKFTTMKEKIWTIACLIHI